MKSLGGILSGLASEKRAFLSVQIQGPQQVERDEFIFGNHSFHYLFSTRLGQAYRETRSSMTEDRVEVVVPEPDLYSFTRNGIIDGLMNDEKTII